MKNLNSRLLMLPLALAMISCSGKKAGKAAPAAANPAAFLTKEAAWCTVESGTRVTENAVDRFEEVFVFKKDGKMAVWSYDLDAKRRIQWNAKGQPRIKSIVEAKFKVEGNKILFSTDIERQSEFEKLTRKLDGKDTNCIKLKAPSQSSVHCACALPEEK